MNTEGLNIILISIKENPTFNLRTSPLNTLSPSTRCYFSWGKIDKNGMDVRVSNNGTEHIIVYFFLKDHFSKIAELEPDLKFRTVEDKNYRILKGEPCYPPLAGIEILNIHDVLARNPYGFTSIEERRKFHFFSYKQEANGGQWVPTSSLQ